MEVRSAGSNNPFAPQKRHRDEVVEFAAGDGFPLNLIHVQGEKPPSRGPVLLVHGAGVRAEIFRAPVDTTVVDALLDHGYDVWLENWRASIDFPPNTWTLDQAALYDHPAAVKKVVEETGSEEIKAIIHCQGSTSFTMSAVAGLVPQVKTIVTNAVSLIPVVPYWSEAKLRYMVPIAKHLTDYFDPSWGLDAPTLTAKGVNLLVKLTHREDETLVSKHVSFTYGAGWPALWNHDNINEATRQWLQYEFKAVPTRFFSNIAKCVDRGHLVAFEPLPGLPEDYTASDPQTDARFAFFAGLDNRCFIPEGQVKAYDYFDAIRGDYHSLHVVPRYGHLDIFMGKDAASDTFPLIIEELDKPTS